MKKGDNTVYEIIAAYRQATLHILTVSKTFISGQNYGKTFYTFIHAYIL